MLPKDLAINALARESAQIKGAGGLRTIEMMVVSGYLCQLLVGRERGLVRKNLIGWWIARRLASQGSHLDISRASRMDGMVMLACELLLMMNTMQGG